MERRVIRSDGRPRTIRPRLLTGQPGKFGHLHVQLWKDNRPRTVRIHRLVLEAFVGPCPAGLEGCHGDGDASNNRLENLRWDTPSENNYDSVRHGTHGMASKTFCKWGHEFTLENTYQPPGARAQRICRQCASRRSRERYERIKQGELAA